MFFLNLSLAEFLTLLGALSALISALYLLDRAKRRKVVSTLRFWVQAGGAEQHQARRRVRDPWSLVLQLLSLLLLLLAVSRMEWGSRSGQGRDHVLLLDTGSWSGAAAAGKGPGSLVIDGEKAAARSYIASLPANDRVMLIAADSLAAPLTRFTSDRRQLLSVLESLAPGFSSLNASAVLAFARQARDWSGGAPGEIVYVGPQLVATGQTSSVPPDRVLSVPADRENCGIRQFTVEQSSDEANTFQALVRIHNYGSQPRTLLLDVHYASTRFAPRRLSLSPGEDISAEYTFTTRSAGRLTAELTPSDSLRVDDRASLFVPGSDLVRIAVYTDRATQLQPLLTANRQLRPVFLKPSQYVPRPDADVIIIDSTAVPGPPALPALWINPPASHAPLPVGHSISDATLTWNRRDVLTTALHAKPLHVASATTFQADQNDEIVASVPAGPVVVLRPPAQGRPSTAVLGFDPAAGPLRFEVASPLLFATLLEELNPGAFRTRTFAAESVGLLRVPLDRSEQSGNVRVVDDRGVILPATRHGSELQLFSAQPLTAHIVSEERERIVDLRLPAAGDQFWRIPSTAPVGLPGPGRLPAAAVDLWKWLALVAAACLLLEWFLFASGRRARRPAVQPPSRTPTGAREEELVSR